jgi:hypothetical protein
MICRGVAAFLMRRCKVTRVLEANRDRHVALWEEKFPDGRFAFKVFVGNQFYEMVDERSARKLYDYLSNSTDIVSVDGSD